MKFKMTKKKAAIGVAVLAVVAIGANTLRSSGPSGVFVTTSEVIQKDILSTLSLKAPLEGTESVEVVSSLHYEILTIDVKEGDKIEKGQVLATLDTTELVKDIEVLQDNIALLRIQNNETTSKSNASYLLAEQQLQDSLEEAQRNYEAALETKSKAETAYQNTEVLFNSGLASQQEMTDALNDLNEAQRKLDSFNVVNGKVVATNAQLKDLENSRNSVNSASAAKSIEIAQKEIQRKQEQLDDCIITSSIEGTVTRVNTSVGRFADEVDDKKPMFVIENVENLRMQVEVSEYDIDKVEVGQPVVLSADILKGETVNGVVSRISPTGEQKSGSTERVVPIQIDIDADSKGLIAGISATAKIETARSENALVVPIEAIMDFGNDTYAVYILNENNTLKYVEVEVGVEDILEIEIIGEGINPGDKVVLNPDYSFEDGMSVISQ